jgi:hypothetical protein
MGILDARPIHAPSACDRHTRDSASREEITGGQILLAALDHLTVPALFATLLNPSVARLYTARGLRSYASLLESEEYKEPFANFLPGILSLTDLPELRSALGDRLKEGAKWDFDTLNALAPSGH